MWLKRRLYSPSSHIYPFYNQTPQLYKILNKVLIWIFFLNCYWQILFYDILSIGNNIGSLWFREWSCSQTAAGTPWGCSVEADWTWTWNSRCPRWPTVCPRQNGSVLGGGWTEAPPLYCTTCWPKRYSNGSHWFVIQLNKKNTVNLKYVSA